MTVKTKLKSYSGRPLEWESQRSLMQMLSKLKARAIAYDFTEDEKKRLQSVREILQSRGVKEVR